MPRKIFGQEPALVVAAINAVVMLAATLGFKFLSDEQAPLWVGIVNGLSAVFLAYTTRPISVGVFSQMFAAIVALVAGYGVELSADFVFAANGALLPILALLTRGQVSPVTTPLTKITANPNAEAANAELGTPGGLVEEPPETG